MENPKATIAEVAALAGVSVGTVSHVLSGRVKVSAKLKERVLGAINTLGYIPNFHAQGLRRSASGVVGLCLPHSSTTYTSALSERMERIAAESGYDIMHVFSRQQPEAELRRVKQLLRFSIDGLILFPSSEPGETLDFLHENGVPVVLIDRSNNDDRFDQVVLDNRKAAQETAVQLIGLGHKRFLFVSRYLRNAVTQHRLGGLKAAQSKAPFSVSIDCVEFRDNESYLAQQIAAVLRRRQRPSVIIASSSHQSAIIIGVIRDLGVRCPEEVSVIAFDETEWSNLITPRLSVIRQPAESICSSAWNLLLRRMSGAAGPPRKITLEAEIVLRESIASRRTSARRAKAKA